VTIDGVNIATLDEKGRTALRKHKVGIVFQKYNLLPTLTAKENIDIALHIAGKPIQWGPNFQEIVKTLGIADRLDHKPRAMSGGEQQRVAIARAIVNEPSILLADEPTGNLDSKNSEAVLELLRDLNRRLGQTIVMITHNPEAAAYGDRIVKMRDGLIVA
jgi:putative ABC transport system ATP-binding protein